RSLPRPPSSPTRRSSDLSFAMFFSLLRRANPPASGADGCHGLHPLLRRCVLLARLLPTAAALPWRRQLPLRTQVSHVGEGAVARSEEHTSELQSRFDLVC